jgi:hypothetical protein
MAFPTTTGQALADRQTLKSYFQYGDVPTEANYATLLDKLATIVELNEEQDARIAADIVLQGNIDTEKAARIAEDIAIRAEFAEEDTAIRAEFALVDTAIRSEFAAEDVAIRSEFAAEDAILQADIVSRSNILLGEISDTNIDVLALQGVDAEFLGLIGLLAIASDHLGAFAGSTIPDGRTVKQALQSLETAHELEISTTNTEIAAHDTRLATLEATTILDSFIFACSSNTGNIATGDVSVFRMPYGFTCTEVRASLITNTAPTAVSLKVFVDGTAITDQVDIAAGATTTYQSGVASTFLLGQNSSPQPIAMDSEVKVNVTSAPTGASGLKVTLVGYVGECAINVVGGSITFPITFPLGTVNTLITCTG